MKSKKKLIYLILVIIALILSYILNIDEQNTKQNIEITGNKIAISNVGEVPENFSLSKDSNLQMFFFDVGQADSILVVDNGITMLIDAGNRADGPLIVEYIKQLNIKKIDYLIATHAHEDHIGGMADIINSFDIGTFFMPRVEKKKTATYKSVEEAAQKKNINIQNPKIGTTFSIGDANCIVKYVDNDEPENLNNSSIVLQLTLDEENYLFMGDAESDIENLGKSKEKNRKINWDKVTVLKVGHHGSSTSSTQYFLNETSPCIAIISVGRNNDYGHPNQNVLKRLISICGSQNIFRTDEDGTIYLEKTEDTHKITKLNVNLDGNI